MHVEKLVESTSRRVQATIASGGDWIQNIRVRNNILGVLSICAKFFTKGIFFHGNDVHVFIKHTVFHSHDHCSELDFRERVTQMLEIYSFEFFLEVVCT